MIIFRFIVSNFNSLRVFKSRLGFALIEFIVILGVISVLLPAVFMLYFASMQNQQKAKVLTQVKQNGDNALSIIESLVKNNATSIYDPNDLTTERCANSSASYQFTDGISFYDKSGNVFTFQLDTSDVNSQKIASISAGSTILLTSDNVTVTALDFACKRISKFSRPIVSVSFAVMQKIGSTRHEQENTLNWATNIQLRN